MLLTSKGGRHLFFRRKTIRGYIGVYAYAIIVHTWADQLLLQLLMEQFDTFPSQCRHIEHMKEFGSGKIILDKMTAMRT